MARTVGYPAMAHDALCRDLDSLEQIVDAFSRILELDVVAQARRVERQLVKATEIYFDETWDSAESLTSSLDSTFSELDYETSELGKAVVQLDQNMDELKAIYEQFVLAQLIVMLVSSLEVYLAAVFTSCLSAKLELSGRAVSDIASRYNFQNWGSSVEAFRIFLDFELCSGGFESSRIVSLQQKRHVLVHRMGVLDERAVRQLGISPHRIGERLRIGPSEIKESIELVRSIGEYVHHAGQEQG